MLDLYPEMTTRCGRMTCHAFFCFPRGNVVYVILRPLEVVFVICEIMTCLICYVHFCEGAIIQECGICDSLQRSFNVLLFTCAFCMRLLLIVHPYPLATFQYIKTERELFMTRLAEYNKFAKDVLTFSSFYGVCG